jgi:hypothetical protein
LAQKLAAIKTPQPIAKRMRPIMVPVSLLRSHPKTCPYLQAI